MSKYITINDEPYDADDVAFRSDPVLSAGTEIWQAEMADYIDTTYVDTTYVDTTYVDTTLNNWEGDVSVEVL